MNKVFALVFGLIGILCFFIKQYEATAGLALIALFALLSKPDSK